MDTSTTIAIPVWFVSLGLTGIAATVAYCARTLAMSVESLRSELSVMRSEIARLKGLIEGRKGYDAWVRGDQHSEI